MSESFVIRDFKNSDFPCITELWEPLGLGSAQRGDSVEIVEKSIQMGGRLLLLCSVQKNSIVGTSWLTVDGRRTYIHHFGIHKEYQGKGLSNLLLKKTLEVAKSIGLQIKLEVHKDNEIALNLYKKVGFTYLGDYDVYIIRDISTLM